MSDREATDAYNANAGVTLPEGIGATYNAALAPLFFGRVGTESSGILQDRGLYGRWYSPDAIWDIFAYYLCIYPDTTWPSSKDSRRQAYSLRCLVSTNNG